MCVGFEPTLPALTACTHACKHFLSISGPVCQPIHLTTYDSRLQSTTIVSKLGGQSGVEPSISLCNPARWYRPWRKDRESNSNRTRRSICFRDSSSPRLVNLPWRKKEESNPGQLTPAACFPNRCKNHLTASSIIWCP